MTEKESTLLIPWAENPFVSRLRSINDRTLLRRLLAKSESAMPRLETLSPDVAAHQFEEWLRNYQYEPTEQSLDKAISIISLGESHAISTYKDRASFIANSSSSEIRVNIEPTTRLFTGYAGVGKTALLDALMCVVRADVPVYQPSMHCPPRKIIGGILVTIRSKTPKAEACKQLADALDIEFDGGVVNEKLISTIRIEMYRQGVLFLIADEVQTQGGDSSTGATFVNFVGFLRTFGVPVIFVGNFSMCHVMLKNHSQNIQRLLVDPLIALPDNHESPDYLRRLQRYKEGCRATLDIDPERDAPQLCEWTFGVNRTFVKLLAIAYKMARASSRRPDVVIDMRALRQARESASFSALRKEVKELSDFLSLKKLPSKKDLICPFEVAGQAAEELDASRMRLIKQQLAIGKLESGLTPADRIAIKQGRAEAPEVVAPNVPVLLELSSSAEPAAAVEQSVGGRQQRRRVRPLPSSADALRWGNQKK